MGQRGFEKNLNSNLGCVKIVSQWRQPGPRQALAASYRCANTCVGGTINGSLAPGVHGCERVQVLGGAISKGLALNIASVPLYYRHTHGTTPLLAPPPVTLRLDKGDLKRT